jgi:hypothetical protein
MGFSFLVLADVRRFGFSVSSLADAIVPYPPASINASTKYHAVKFPPFFGQWLSKELAA